MVCSSSELFLEEQVDVLRSEWLEQSEPEGDLEGDLDSDLAGLEKLRES